MNILINNINCSTADINVDGVIYTVGYWENQLCWIESAGIAFMADSKDSKSPFSRFAPLFQALCNINNDKFDQCGTCKHSVSPVIPSD